MTTTPRPDVENIPADLDRFLGNFFNRRGWRSEIKYDPADDRLYLDVRLASVKLSADDRFFSLIEYFTRAQDNLLRQRAGLPLQCRVYATDGSDLTGTLHTRASSYLDDVTRSTGMRRRLFWLSMRRRLVRHMLPGALLWAFAFVFVVVVVGVSFDTAVLVALGALAFQAVILLFFNGRRV